MRNAFGFAVAPVALIFGLATAIAQDRPAFEVATIKLAASNAAPRNQLVRVSPNRISIPSMTLSWLIYTAYGEGMSTSTAVVGGPDWRNQIAIWGSGIDCDCFQDYRRRYLGLTRRQHNISRASLFPGLDGFAQSLGTTVWAELCEPDPDATTKTLEGFPFK